MEQLSIEKKVQLYEQGMQFMKELLASFETMSGIADAHGARTVVDLLYLHSAILSDGFIDVYPNESSLLLVVHALPSAKRWLKFIKIEFMASGPGPDIISDHVLADSEQFALDEWLTEYPDNACFDQVLDMILSMDESVCVTDIVESRPPQAIVELIQNTKTHYELSGRGAATATDESCSYGPHHS